MANLKELQVITQHLGRYQSVKLNFRCVISIKITLLFERSETFITLHGMDHKWSWQQLELHQSLPAKL